MGLNHQLNEKYLKLHTDKEESFWALYMAHKSCSAADFEKKEKELREFISDPSYLPGIRDELNKKTAADEERRGLEGWKAFFKANAIESAEARSLSAKIIEMEVSLGNARKNIETGYIDPDSGEFVEAGTGKLALIIANDHDESKRKAAWEGLRGIGTEILDKGYPGLVRARNRLSRMLGFEDFYDYRVFVTEGISKKELFDIIDDLELKTRDAFNRSMENLSAQSGENAVRPWNVDFFSKGSVSVELDPFFRFQDAVPRWGRSFAAMGIGFANSIIQMDLAYRKGKYENGFCHAPFPSYIEDGRDFRGKTNFTANAVPGQTGGGLRAIKTLMHEGGHAAHFGNIKMPSPCFSQEFAPTSPAFAEVQSMFMDSLLYDADWLYRYAADGNGKRIPVELIRKNLETKNKYLARELRYLVSIPYIEKGIYELPDDQLTGENIRSVVKNAEEMVFLGEESYRPGLSVPHLLAGESAAGYHGYALARLAVFQTKAWFLNKYGRIVDNPAIGRELRDKYWRTGNLKTLTEYIKDLTGEEFSSEAAVKMVNKTLSEIFIEADNAITEIRAVPEYTGPVNLQAEIKLVHGDEKIASNKNSTFEEMAERYARWLAASEKDKM